MKETFGVPEGAKGSQGTRHEEGVWTESRGPGWDEQRGPYGRDQVRYVLGSDRAAPLLELSLSQSTDHDGCGMACRGVSSCLWSLHGLGVSSLQSLHSGLGMWR
jgi:hypothetical protein